MGWRLRILPDPELFHTLGTDRYSVDGDRLEPREFRETSEEDEDAHDGYLIVGDEIWDESGDVELLPETWVRQTKAGLVPRKEKKHLFPVRLHFDEYGNCSETTPKKWWGWFMRAPLLFDPTSGTFYDTKTNEGTKLTKLGSEGRSTSTTITAFTILNQLADAGFKPEDQKLLSFTDNRQDAALQAGHFNDFVQVIQLRAAILSISGHQRGLHKIRHATRCLHRAMSRVSHRR
jgi:hypothetical protein